MRGASDPQLAMLTTSNPDSLIPKDHPIRRIRVVVDAVLADLDDTFDEMYAGSCRSSVPSEALLKSTVLMAMYSMRSERAFCERLDHDLLFTWFLDMRIDRPAFVASTFSKNRRRLLDHDAQRPDRRRRAHHRGRVRGTRDRTGNVGPTPAWLAAPDRPGRQGL